MKKICLTALLAVFFSMPSQAEKIGLYVQGNAGTLDSDLNGNACQQIDDSLGSIVAYDSSSCKAKSPSGKLLVGYKVAPHFALEATYFVFGKEVFSADSQPTLTTKINVLNVEDKLTAFGLGGAVHFDLTDSWSAIARFGFAKTKHKVTADFPTLGQSRDVGSESHTKYYAGGGLAYAITPLFKLHGDLDYTKVRLESVDEHGVRLLSVGGSLNF